MTSMTSSLHDRKARALSSTEWLWLAGLLLLYSYLWLRDSSWLAHTGDTLPVLAGLPLFALFATPLVRRHEPLTTNDRGKLSRLLAIAVTLALAGLLADSSTLLTLGWTGLCAVWLFRFLHPSTHPRLIRLLPLLLLSFPWLTQEGTEIGWYFRLSAAWVTAGVYALLGFTVERQGTLLQIQGTLIGIDAPCAGLNVLQSLLLAGTALAQVTSGGRRWPTIPLLLFLVSMAWFANVLRILMLCAAAITFGIPFARGLFHTWGGLLALLLMFLLCAAVFSLGGTAPEKEGNLYQNMPLRKEESDETTTL